MKFKSTVIKSQFSKAAFQKEQAEQLLSSRDLKLKHRGKEPVEDENTITYQHKDSKDGQVLYKVEPVISDGTSYVCAMDSQSFKPKSKRTKKTIPVSSLSQTLEKLEVEPVKSVIPLFQIPKKTRAKKAVEQQVSLAE